LGEDTYHSFSTKPPVDEKYKVLEIKATNSNEDKDSDPFLPRHPFFMLAIGPRYTGKSNATLDMILNKFGPGYWDNIIVYCKTIDDDNKWDHLRVVLDERNLRTEYSQEQLTVDYHKIADCKARNPNFRTLLVFDDMIGDGLRSSAGGAQDPLSKFAAMGRHKNCDVVVTSQYYRALGPTVRTNCTNLLIFNQTNGKEIEKLIDENRGLLLAKEFRALLKAVVVGKDINNTKERPFLHVNNQRDVHERFTKNWDQQIVIKEEGGKTKIDLEAPPEKGVEEKELDVSEGEFESCSDDDKENDKD